MFKVVTGAFLGIPKSRLAKGLVVASAAFWLLAVAANSLTFDMPARVGPGLSALAGACFLGALLRGFIVRHRAAAKKEKDADRVFWEHLDVPEGGGMPTRRGE